MGSVRVGAGGQSAAGTSSEGSICGIGRSRVTSGPNTSATAAINSTVVTPIPAASPPSAALPMASPPWNTIR